MNTGIQDAHNLAWKLAAGIITALFCTLIAAGLLKRAASLCRVRLSVYGGMQ